jgi:hypothetical protein
MNPKSYFLSKNGTVKLPFLVIAVFILFFIYLTVFPSADGVEGFLGDEMYEYFTTPVSSKILTPSSSRASTTAPVSSRVYKPSSSRMMSNTPTGSRMMSNTPTGSRMMSNTPTGSRMMSNTPTGSRMMSNTPTGSRMFTPASLLSASTPSPFTVMSNNKEHSDMNTIHDTRYNLDSNKIAIQPPDNAINTNTPPLKLKEHKPYVEKNFPGEVWSNFLEGFNFP